MIHLLHRDKSTKFYPFDYSEKKNKLINPLRGWYKIFYFDINETPDYSFIESSDDDSQKLVMAFVDISSVKMVTLMKNAGKILRIFLTFLCREIKMLYCVLPMTIRAKRWNWNQLLLKRF